MTTEPYSSFSSQGSLTPFAPFSTALCVHHHHTITPSHTLTNPVKVPAVLHTESNVFHAVSMSSEVSPHLLVPWEQSRLKHKDHLTRGKKLVFWLVKMVLNHIFLSDGMGDDVSLLCLQSSVGHWFEPHLGTVVVGSLQGGRERGGGGGGGGGVGIYILINNIV